LASDRSADSLEACRARSRWTVREVRTVHQMKKGMRGRRRSRIGGGLKGQSWGRWVCARREEEAMGWRKWRRRRKGFERGRFILYWEDEGKRRPGKSETCSKGQLVR
jgi:hypothetical protein